MSEQIVKENIARSSKKKLLTFCQFNRTKVEVRTVRRDIWETWHAITYFLQVNRNGVRRQVLSRGIAKAAGMNHSQTMKSTRSDRRKSMTQDSTGPGMESLTS